MLACWSVVLIGLSHFLHFTYLLAFAVFIQSFRKLHFFFHTAPPTPHKSWSSFAHYVSIVHFTNGAFVFSTRQIHVLAAWLHFVQLSFSTHTKAPNVHSLLSTPFVLYAQPLFLSTCNVQAKRCANPAASSTLPQHFVLPVSGALPPLAAARTQRTGLKLHFVTLHFAFKPCYPR